MNIKLLYRIPLFFISTVFADNPTVLDQSPMAARLDFVEANINQIELNSDWDSISQGWSEAIDLNLSGREISSISITKENPANRLYVGTNKKQLYRVDNANSDNPIITEITKYFDPSAGMVSGDYFHGFAYINNIAIHPNDGDVALVVFSNYEVYSMYYTTDGGESWIRAGGNLEQQSNGGGNGPSCRWASIMPFGEDTLYFVATSTGLYATNKITIVSLFHCLRISWPLRLFLIDSCETQ